MQRIIVSVHGMFQTAKSREGWIGYFTQKDYHYLAPSWPAHEGETAYPDITT